MVDSSDLTRQYISSLSILAVCLFVGVPIWWKTTEVYRCPLPYDEIGDLRDNHVSLCVCVSSAYMFVCLFCLSVRTIAVHFTD